MKITKSQKIIAFSAIALLLVSLALMFVDIFVPEFKFGYHPILTFLFCNFVGLGIICLTLGVLKKSSFYFFLSAILLGLSIFYVFIILSLKYWWAGVIVLAAFWFIMSIFCFISGSNKTESIALNDRPDYKNYEQRKAEKEAKKAEEKEKELPKLKSFKE